MTPAAPARALHGLRLRLTLLLMAGMLLAGIGFEALLVSVTWRGQQQELETRGRSLARLMAERSQTPLLLSDTGELLGEARRAMIEPDLVGAEVREAGGRLLARHERRARLWGEVGSLQIPAGAPDVSVRLRHLPGEDVLDVVAPVLRPPRSAGSLSEASQVFGLPEAAAPAVEGETLGWVRLVFSTARARAVAEEAGRKGFTLLLAALFLGLFAVSIYVRFIVRPLQEAGELARAIASGQLERRLPVRGADELGDLAQSMNIMAGALQRAQELSEAEAEVLRSTSGAMLSIARGARDEHDPDLLFARVTAGLKRVARCRAVALAVPPPEGSAPVVTNLDPPAPCGEIALQRPVPEGLLRLALHPQGGAARFDIAADDPAWPGLAAEGLRSALLVPMELPDSPPALLLALSADPRGFTPNEVDVVVALTSHLSSALHAARLDRRLEGAYEQLERTRDYLVQSEMLRVAGELAAGVAHDFNNLLGAVLGRAQLLQRQLESGHLSTEQLVTSLAVIERAALDGRETGRRLRQFGQVAKGTAAPVDLHEVLRDALEFTRTRWENEALAAGLTIEVRLESVPGAWIAGRVSELREVFTNLLLNAVDALHQGGVVRLGTRHVDGQVRAWVADDGIGMDEETARRAFEPFFTTKGERGTGLGLSVVYGIVQQHGGTIAVESKPGAGTRLELCFDAVAAPAPVAPPEPVALGEAPLEVLVVDDEDSVRDVLSDIASVLGHRVVACASGDEAIRVFRPGRFQLVLTDLGMPGMTGWELAHRVRLQDPAVTIAFVTGWGDEVDPRSAAEAGADLVLGKPFTVEDVARATQLAGARSAAARAAESAADRLAA